MTTGGRLADVVDAALELPVAPGFTKVGIAVRSRLDGWAGEGPPDVGGRVVVVTGATSGLGFAAAASLGAAGATVVLTGRDRDRVERTARDLSARTGSDALDPVAADMAEPDQVAALADHVRHAHGRVDVVVHNAGALSSERSESSEGIESTVAAQVLGPFRLTAALLADLRRTSALVGRPSRVLTMSSGGMYAAPLTVSGLQLPAGSYDGTRQYALAKRAQVTLNEMWAERIDAAEVVVHSVHPGWADTPGVRSSLPGFAKVVGPLLRSPEQGADTLVWLAADDGEPLDSTGGFWSDRRQRPLHRLPSTRRSDTPERRARLWDWCVSETAEAPDV